MSVDKHRDARERFSVGDELNVTIDRLAHGADGIGTLDGQVVFVRGGLPGDDLRAKVSQVKKSFVRADLVDVDKPSAMRVAQRCPAAGLGAGCCDYGEVDPQAEIGLKVAVLEDQLRRIGKLKEYPEIETIDLQPREGWRTRVRLGVNAEGLAGIRKAKSNDLVTEVGCSQVAPGLLEGLVGENAQKFTPNAELVAVLDADGERHVIESVRAPRGKQVTRIVKVTEGSGQVTEKIDGFDFKFPAIGFWQAHVAAPQAYVDTAREWLAPFGSSDSAESENARPVAWDLYGGVGLFVPALIDALNVNQAPAGKKAPKPLVHSVELSKDSAAAGRQAVGSLPVEFHSGQVEQIMQRLPDPSLVILDPPRKGAGAEVVTAIAARAPKAVIHVGCDPATFARDVATWAENGYKLEKLRLFNAFPGTHHAETFGLLVPAVTTA